MTKIKLNDLSWESNFFCKKIGKIIDFNNIQKDELSKFDLICNKVPASNYDQINTLNQLNFKYVEGEVQLIKTIEKTTINLDGFDVVVATVSDLNSLLKVSNHMFKFSRFRQPWFETSKASEFYGVWKSRGD